MKSGNGTTGRIYLPMCIVVVPLQDYVEYWYYSDAAYLACAGFDSTGKTPISRESLQQVCQHCQGGSWHIL